MSIRRQPSRPCGLCAARTAPTWEIFQYTAPDQDSEQPRNSDIGGHHLAFYTTDMDGAVAYLQDKGITVLGAPTTMSEGPSAGETWVYFLAPWGMQLELVSYPDGKAYEADFDARLWDPRSLIDFGGKTHG